MIAVLVHEALADQIVRAADVLAIAVLGIDDPDDGRIWTHVKLNMIVSRVPLREWEIV